jgi:hypothetical protein
MTERPRLAQREPRSLLPEQMGQLTVSTPAIPQQVQAWVLWEDGVEELEAAGPQKSRSVLPIGHPHPVASPWPLP